MTFKPDKALALSNPEAEALRDLRHRLNRPVSDKAASVLLNAVFQTAARVDIVPPPGQGPLSLEGFVAKVDEADMGTLRAAVAALKEVHGKGPAASLKAAADGWPQAVLSRRLVLGGREQPKEGTGA